MALDISLRDTHQQPNAHAQLTSPTCSEPSDANALPGVDLGFRWLATFAGADCRVQVFPNFISLRAAITECRKVGKSLSQRVPRSSKHLPEKAKLIQAESRCMHFRGESVHQLTRFLGDIYGDMTAEALGKRAFRRSASDVEFGAFRPRLTNSAEGNGVNVGMNPSSQIHYGCRDISSGTKLAKQLIRSSCHRNVNGDENAAMDMSHFLDYGLNLASANAEFGSGPVSTGGSSNGETTYRRRKESKASSETDRICIGENCSWTYRCQVQDEAHSKDAL